MGNNWDPGSPKPDDAIWDASDALGDHDLEIWELLLMAYFGVPGVVDFSYLDGAEKVCTNCSANIAIDAPVCIRCGQFQDEFDYKKAEPPFWTLTDSQIYSELIDGDDGSD